MLARVFPRKTNAMPTDEMAFVGYPDLFSRELGISEVHVSCTFTWDLDRANRLRDAWEKIAPARIGGPALGDRHGEFVAGRYLKRGYTITSRGCPRRCWFCDVWKFNPQVHCLPIVDGWKIQDDNLLACPESHFLAVMEMLRHQPCRAEFTGGLEALMLQDWHVHQFASLTPKPVCFFAYDPGDEFETLAVAAKKMLEAGFTRESHRLRCYVLVGWAKDSFDEAESRLNQMLQIGFTPMAMLWRNPKTGQPKSPEWKAFQRRWTRPAIIHSRTDSVVRG
jgi:hypothetical protein